MTSEDRLKEIEDYISYLTTVHTEVFSMAKKRNIKKCLLGFSQGTATATRWFEKSSIHFDNLILWGGHLASDSNLKNSKYAETPVTLVYGVEDKLLLPTYYEDDIAILKRYNVKYNLFSYNGGHAIDADTLIKISNII
jgi:predicted esterase